jgi:hypothetical protein
MAKPERLFRHAGGGKNIVLFRGRKKSTGCFFPGPCGVHVLNVAPGSEGPGVLTGVEICNGGDRPGMGDAEIRVAVIEIGPSSGFGKNFSVPFTTGLDPFPRRHRPVQFPQNAPAFGP